MPSAKTITRILSQPKRILLSDGFLYRHRSNGNHQLVVPATVVREVMRENHAPVYIAHPGAKRTHDLIALHYWWPGMRKDIEDYVRSCDSCQRKKEDREFVAPLGSVQEPTTSFEVTAMDVSGPYPVTPRGNKFLLTFIDHFCGMLKLTPSPIKKQKLVPKFTRHR